MRVCVCASSRTSCEGRGANVGGAWFGVCLSLVFCFLVLSRSLSPVSESAAPVPPRPSVGAGALWCCIIRVCLFSFPICFLFGSSQPPGGVRRYGFMRVWFAASGCACVCVCMWCGGVPQRSPRGFVRFEPLSLVVCVHVSIFPVPASFLLSRPSSFFRLPSPAAVGVSGLSGGVLVRWEGVRGRAWDVEFPRTCVRAPHKGQ